MPSSGLPYADKMIKWFDITDNDTQVLLGDINMENFTITPELRFYSGKKRYGRGFYFALFYRYGQYRVNNAIIPFETDLEDGTLNASFDMTSHTGGIMIGAQWALGKHLCLDWWIRGEQILHSHSFEKRIFILHLPSLLRRHIFIEYFDVDNSGCGAVG